MLQLPPLYCEGGSLISRLLTEIERRLRSQSSDGTTSADSKTPSATIDVLSLEDRILYSATPIAEPIDPAEAMDVDDSGSSHQESNDDGAAQATADTDGTDDGSDLEGDASAFDTVATEDVFATSESLTTSHELVFIDANLEDVDLLINDLLQNGDPSREIEVILLTNERSGIEQISEALAGYSDLDAIHLVSHGADGNVVLGNTVLNSSSLTGYASEVSLWAGALSADADMLFYGCDLAGDDGVELLESIAALCDCDVAASEDKTGSSELNADWDLEYVLGVVETDVVFSASAQESWYSTLDITTGLEVHLTLDEESGTVADDQTANNNDGTVNGTATWTSGEYGNAFEFNTSDGEDYIEIANSPSLENVQENDYTLAAWFRPDSTPPGSGNENDANYGVMVKAGWHTGIYFNGDNRFLFDHQFSDGSSITLSSANTFATGQFYHVAVIFNRSAGTAEMYVDGQLEDTNTFTANKTAREYGTGTWKLGIANPGGAEWGWPADGAIDDARIFSRALSASDVAELVNLYPGSNATDSSNEHITNVTLGTINNTTLAEASGYADYTDLSTSVIQGSSQTLSVSIDAWGSNYLTAWVDWNQDFDFDDPGETYVLGTNIASNDDGPHTVTIDAPVDAVLGTTRMRVSLSETTAPSSTGTFAYGEVEDYKIVVVSSSNNASPVAVDDSYTITSSGTTQNVLSNDTDSDGGTLTVIDSTDVSNGTLVDNGGGSYTYTPNAEFNGYDSFDYLVDDGQTGLIHYYGLAGDGTDSVGSNDASSITGTSAVEGTFGEAMWFDEVDDKVIIPDFTYPDEFSISFDFKVDDNSGSFFQYLYSQGTIETQNSLQIVLAETGSAHPNTLRTSFADSNDTIDSLALDYDASSLINDGNWHNYTLTVSKASGAIVYVDGVKVAQDSTRGGDAFNPTGDVYLGSRYDSDPDRFFGGGLDSLRIYGQELSSYEVASIADPSGESATASFYVEGTTLTETEEGGLSLNQDGGNDAYLLADDGGSLLGGRTAFTYEINYSTTDTTAQTLVSYATASNDNEFKLILQSNGDMLAQVGSGFTTINTFNFNSLADGEEHTISFSWTNGGGNWTVYVDGASVASGTGLSDTHVMGSGGAFVIGNEQDSVNGGFDSNTAFSALLHDVRLFSDVRTATEIAQSYRTTLPYDEEGLVANWTFSDLSKEGLTTDSVGGNNLSVNHATGVGFVSSEAELTLLINENSADGTIVGSVEGVDADREAQIQSFLASDSTLRYNATTGKFYKIVSASVDWDTAKTNAESTTLNGLTGQLAVIRSAAENDFITSYSSELVGGSIWLGGTDATVEGEWRWIEDGSEADMFWDGAVSGDRVGDYSNWYSATQPNDSGGDEDALRLDTTSGKWYDAPVTWVGNSYVVEWDADEVLDQSQAITYAIQSQTVAGAFTINSDTGQITVADGSLLDYETNSTHTITVRTTDVDLNTRDTVYTISLGDVVDEGAAPTDLSSGIELNTDGGNDAYLVTTNAQSILGGRSQLTFETSFSVTDDTAQQTLVSYTTASQDNAFLVVLRTDGRLMVSITNSATMFSEIDYTAVLADGAQHHVAVSWDNTAGIVKTYIDGELIETKSGIRTGQTLSSNSSSAIVFGQEQDWVNGAFNSAETFRGTLYDVRIWDDARSDAEISLNYQQKFDAGSLPSGLVANWQMDGFNGSNEVVDVVSGNNLSVAHASGTGFIASTPVNDLHVYEESSNGTSVGFVVPSDPDVTSDIVSDGLFNGSANTATQYGVTGTFGDWTVEEGSIDLFSLADFSSPLDGRVVNLDGAEPSTISQTLTTEVGHQYQVIFQMNGDFSGGEAEKNLRVSAGGESADFSMTEPTGWTWGEAGYFAGRTFTFTADSTSTELMFASLEGPTSQYGPYIADVQVVEIPPAVTEILNADPSLTYDAGTGKFYKVVSTTVDVTTAMTNAGLDLINGIGGQLVTIRSAYENELITSMIQGLGNEFYIGATDATTEGSWRWIEDGVEADAFWSGDYTGTTVTGAYSNLHSGEPNDWNAGEDYLAILASTGTWLDLSGAGARGYVIEWDANDILSNYTFSLTDDAGGRFAIDSNTGEVTVANGSLLDYESNTSHDITVQVQDAAGKSYTEVMTIAVDDLSDDALLTVPIAQSVNEDTTLSFSVAGGNAIVLDDGSSDSPLVSVNLQVANGSLTLATTSGITFLDGTSNGSSSLTISGTEADINAALDGLQYQGDLNFNGSDTLTVTTGSASASEANLYARYEFLEGSTSDVSGNGYDGTLGGDPTFAVDAERGDVMTFDGNDSLTITNGALGLGDEVTISAWVNLDAGQQEQTFLSIGDEFYVILDRTNASYSMGVVANNFTTNNLSSVNNIAGEGWNHVAATLNDVTKELHLYLNGVLIRSSTFSFTDIDWATGSSPNITIGSLADGTKGFVGSLDDVRVYSSEFSQTEIISLMGDHGYASESVAITVNAVNDTPDVVGPGSAYTVNEQTNLTIEGTGFSVTDVDAAAGTMTATFNVGEGTLSLVAGDSGVSITANDAGTVSFTGSLTQINNLLTGASTGTITYVNGNDAPSASTTILLTINDGGNTGSDPGLTGDGTSEVDSASQTINVTAINDDPVLTLNPGGGTYNEGGAGTFVDFNASVTDADGLDFSGGTLTVSLVSNGESTDRLIVKHEGTGAGQVNVVGSTILIDGVQVATYTGGVGVGDDLVVTFNANADQADVESITQRIAYMSVSENPSTLQRTISMEVTDGDGGTSATGTRVMNVIAHNDDPTNSGSLPTDISVVEDVASNVDLSAVNFSDVDEAGGALTVTLSTSTGGELTVAAGTGITLGGTATARTFTGTIADLNTYFNDPAKIQYLHPTANLFGNDADTLTVVINDNGNTGLNGGTDVTLGTVNVDITAVNDAPVEATIEGTTIAYTENDGSVAVTSSLSLGDVDDTNLESAVVQITSNYVNGEDLLSFTNQNGITGSWDSGTGTLTLSGSATLAQYETALRSISYTNSSDDPSALTRTVSFTVNDGDDNSNTVSRDIAITAVNDAPVASNIEGTALAYAENDGAVTITSSINFTDVDDTNIESAVVQMNGNFNSGEDVLSFSNQNGITGTYNSTNGTWTLTGSATLAQYETAIRSITYTNTSENPDTTTRTVSFTVNDGDANSNTLTRDIAITSVNDAPTADHGGPYTINEGDSLNLDASGSTDIESGTLTYRWDLDNDGQYDDLVTTSATSNVSWATLYGLGVDDDGVYTIGLQVDDGTSGITNTSTTLTINNAAPILSATGAATAGEGSVYTLTLTDTDPGNDTISSWIVNWGDGNIETFVGDPSSVTHTYSIDLVGLTLDISVSAIDEDGQYFESHLLAPAYVGDFVAEYDGFDGAFVGSFAPSTDGLNGHANIVVMPSGNYLVSGVDSGNILEYQPDGTLVGEFVAAGVGGLNNPGGIAYGPDGNLYVADFGDGEILRYDGATGAFIDAFVASGTPGMSSPLGLEFGPDGDLYVASRGGAGVLRFDGSTGTHDTGFTVAPISNAEDLTFGPDGNLYVASLDGGVLRIDASTGANLGTFVSLGSGGLTSAAGVEFGPDGNLYVADQDADVIRRYNGSTGAYIDDYATGINGPAYMEFTADHRVTITNVVEAPINTVPGPQSVDEDSVVAITGISVADGDDNLSTVQLSVTNGVLNVSLSGTAAISSGANGSSTLTLSGSLADINTVLATLTYQGNSNFNGSDTLTILSTDADLATDSDTVGITVGAVNDDPTNAGSLPTDITVVEDASSNVDLSAIDLSDVDASSGSLTVKLTTSTGGNLTAAAGTGITIGSNGSGAITISGSLTDLNNYLNTASNIQYLHGTTNTFGNDADTINVKVNDNGNTGTGGGTDIDFGTINVDITAVNDAPLVGTNTGTTVVEGGSVTITTAMLNEADVDDSGTGLTYSVTSGPTNGQLELTTNVGVAITSFTQDDIDNNRVAFVHDGTQAVSDSFDFSLADGGEDAAAPATGTFNFTVTNVNDAPVASNIEGVALSYTENDGAVAVTSTINFTDVDDTNIESAVVQITGGYNSGEDVLSFTNQNGISGSYNSTNGTWTLTGSATLAQYETAIRSITYTNTSENPDTTTRTVSFTVNDGDANSNTLTRDITIGSVNDDPFNSGTLVSDVTVTEDVSSTIDLSAIDFSDVDATSGSLTVTLSTSTGGQISGAAGTGITVGGTANARTFTGSLTDLNAYFDDVANISYLHSTTHAYGNDVDTIQVVINDNGNTGSGGGTDRSLGTVNVDIAGVNDAPINSVPGSQTTSEEVALVFSTGNGNLISISDEVGDSLFVTISVNNGTLTLSGTTGLTFENGTSNGDSTVSISGSVADVNAALEGLSYDPATNFSGSDTLTIATADETIHQLNIHAGLEGLYSFHSADPGADESTSGSNDGTLVGNATTLTDTNRGDVLSLDGDGDRVSISGFMGSNANVTIAAWVDLQTADTNGSTVLQISNRLGLRLDSGGNIVAFFNDGVGTQSITYAEALESTGWRHVAFTFDDAANTAKLYLDGVEVASKTITESIDYSGATGGTSIGGLSPDGYDFNGFMDDVRFYGSALSATDIADLAAYTGDASDTDTVAITVNNANDAPVLDNSGTPTVTAITEDDIDNAGMTVAALLATGASGDPISDADGDPDGIAITTRNNGNGVWQYSVDGGANWSNVGTVSESSALLLRSTDLVRFNPDGENGISQTFEFRAWDQTSGTQGTKVDTTANGGSTAFSSAIDTASITVSHVNDAPVLDNSGSVSLATQVEDSGSPVGAVGTVITDLVSIGGNITDVDDSAQAGVAITSTDTTNGTWWYTTDNGSNWSLLGAVSDSSARVLNADSNTRIYFESNSNFNGTVSNAITFRAWDRTEGANGSLQDASSNGGTTSYSSASETADITITAINDAPVASNIEGTALSYTENDGTVAVTSTINFTDVDDTNIESAVVQITGGYNSGEDVLSFTNQNGITGAYNSTNGTWTLTGSATLAQYETAIRSITYSNTSENPDTTTRTVSFTVNDGDANSNTLTRDITIGSVNDDPTNAGSLVSDVAVTEDVLTAVDLSGLDFSDVDASSSDLTVTLSTSTGGELTLAADASIDFGGTSTSRTLTGTLAELNSYFNNTTNIQYLHGTQHLNGNDADTIQVVINDNGNTGSGGGADQNLGTVNVDITAVNDAPLVGTNTGTTVAEGGSVTITTATLNEADVDDSGAGLTYSVTSGPTNGQLELTTNVGVAITSFTQDDIDNNRVVFVHDGTQAVSDSFDFSLADGGEDAAAPATGTFNFTVTNVNDAPVASNIEGVALSYTENDGAASVTSTINFTDVDDANIESAVVQITGGYNSGEDVLSFTNQNGISGSYNSTNGTWTLTGSATLAQYETAIRSITYTNTSENPDTTTRTVSFTVNDGDANSNTLTRDIAIGSINDDPTNAGSLPSDLSVTEDVLSNVDLSSIDLSDLDANGSSLTVTLTTSTGGQLSASSGGGVTVGGNATSRTFTGSLVDLNAFFDNAANIQYVHGTTNTTGNNADSITVVVNDNGNTGTGGGADQNLGTVNVDITNVNDAPDAVADLVVGNEDSNLSGNVLGNDSDADGNPLTAVLGQNVSNGTLTFNPDGSFIYTPAPDFFGVDQFTYFASDSNLLSAETTVQLQVLAVNDQPIATADQFVIRSNETLSLAASSGLIINDVDVDGDTLTAVLVSGPAQGALTLGADGSIVYIPQAGFVGQVSFSYYVTDGSLSSSTVTVSIDVQANGGVVVDDSGDTSNDNTATSDESDSTTTDTTGDADAVSSEEKQAVPVAGPVERTQASQAAEAAPKQEALVPVLIADEQEESGRNDATESSVVERRITLKAPGFSALDWQDGGFDSTFDSQSQYDFVYEITQLNQSLEEFGDQVTEREEYQRMISGAATGVFLGATAGGAIWLMSSSYFAALLSSSLPVWARFDPIYIVRSQPIHMTKEDSSLAQIIRQEAGYDKDLES